MKKKSMKKPDLFECIFRDDDDSRVSKKRKQGWRKGFFCYNFDVWRELLFNFIDIKI